ncbi:BREX system ATP-binding protein BrxD [Desertimonas flava]|uniref:BREX system ATP-binding protein BrxD n=1 Tax=Desertimonas flava TaxID=2064846 RepID=UPI000E350B87|nr:BREX system ATP-binding protein BrxD [Desertimonas flava]
MISPHRRREIIDALRRGTVPQQGLDALAVGTERYATAIGDELDGVAAGGAGFKAVRGEWGSGKTFTVRWIAELARSRGFATAEVQISEGETPLHHLETVYRRLCERLTTSDSPSGTALQTVVDSWFYALHDDVVSSGSVATDDSASLLDASTTLAEQRLGDVARRAPALAAVLRAYRQALADNRVADAQGLLAWLGGQPHVAASIKRTAGIRGDLDHDGALAFLGGLLTILRGAGYSGLVLVLDEVETLQRVRRDTRDRALNAMRQLIDEVDQGRFPGLYLMITGTPAFFDGPQGASRLPPLAQRLHTDFTTEARFDNPRAVQLRLPGFDLSALVEVGGRVRDLYAAGASDPERIRRVCDDEYVRILAQAVTGDLGGRVGVAPRLFLKKLVGDVLDRVDQFAEFDPRADYELTVVDGELSDVERNARAAASVDEIDLDL